MPSLYYGLKDGTFMSAGDPDFAYNYAYAGASYGDATWPFPDGLRMITGSPSARSPETSLPIEHGSWTCLDDNTETNGFPIDKRCKSLQAKLVFPSCSAGKAETADFKSHMACAWHGPVVASLTIADPKNDSCPSTHPKQVPRITFKVTWGASLRLEAALTSRFDRDVGACDGRAARAVRRVERDELH